MNLRRFRATTIFVFSQLLSCAIGFSKSASWKLLSPGNRIHENSVGKQPTTGSTLKSSSTILQLSNQPPGQYDISKPVFDLYSFRSIRGDALAKYSSLNQSEPLRINIFAFLALSFLSSPFISQDLTGQSQSLPQTAAAIAGGVGSALLFLRECQKRSRQLTRLEKELQALSLPIQLPRNLLSDAPFDKPSPVMQVLREKSVRILAVSGTAYELRDSLELLQVLGNRLVQANTYVVVVPTDGSNKKDWLSNADNKRFLWLAEPALVDAWKNYFSLLKGDDARSSFRWFGLTPSGRSFGSGTTAPSWLQVMGKSLSPTDILDEDDSPLESTTSSPEVAKIILDGQAEFYKALTTGDLNSMNKVYDQNALDEEITAVMKEGGRLDSWKFCLEDDARPEGMKIAGSDCVQLSDTLAYSTTIEFPALIPGATLLAVQKWVRSNKNSTDWKMVKHQTIPWTADTPAGGTLLCDCRGCVSLVRSNERRTFGGLIG